MQLKGLVSKYLVMELVLLQVRRKKRLAGSNQNIFIISRSFGKIYGLVPTLCGLCVSYVSGGGRTCLPDLPSDASSEIDHCIIGMIFQCSAFHLGNWSVGFDVVFLQGDIIEGIGDKRDDWQYGENIRTAKWDHVYSKLCSGCVSQIKHLQCKYGSSAALILTCVFWCMCRQLYSCIRLPTQEIVRIPTMIFVSNFWCRPHIFFAETFTMHFSLCVVSFPRVYSLWGLHKDPRESTSKVLETLCNYLYVCQLIVYPCWAFVDNARQIKDQSASCPVFFLFCSYQITYMSQELQKQT